MQKYDIVTDKVCQTCKHYRQHYSKSENIKRYWALSYGHCVYPRNKPRYIDQTCPNWEPKPDETNPPKA